MVTYLQFLKSLHLVTPFPFDPVDTTKLAGNSNSLNKLNTRLCNYQTII